MAYTLEQYTKLQEAIAGGELSVRYADRSVQYRTLDEMVRLLQLMEADLFPSNGGGSGGRRRYASFSKGY
ncbi:phage head-tail joining protein [Pseudomonas sp. ML96]|uniref:phage head-tail joining protein n=1 Tax=Pseudomonas sp. ML96 TaxID=1523503 RepID=UPI0005BA3A60|nr:hypothetical protein [Pseudomonas sp. ML96]